MPIVIEVDCPFCGEEKLTWQNRVCKKTKKQISYTDLLALTIMDLMDIVKPIEIVEDVIEEAGDVIAAVADKVENIAEVVVEKAKEVVEEVKEIIAPKDEQPAEEPEPEPEPEAEPEPEPVERKDIEEIEEELKQL